MSNPYNSNKVIANKQQKLGKLNKDIDKMWQSPLFDVEECPKIQFDAKRRN